MSPSERASVANKQAPSRSRKHARSAPPSPLSFLTLPPRARSQQPPVVAKHRALVPILSHVYYTYFSGTQPNRCISNDDTARVSGSPAHTRLHPDTGYARDTQNPFKRHTHHLSDNFARTANLHTMTDYASLKVPELKKLLQEKSLSATGNKADLIARLKEHDEPQGASKSSGGVEDEIDWDDEEPAKPAAAETAAAPTASEEPTVETEPAQVAESAPAAQASDVEAAAEQPAPEEAVAPKADFSAGLAASSADDEARKRADRAKRFGITPAEKTDEETKKVERASRFGIEKSEENNIVMGLDAALPERRERKRGREGVETTNTGGDRVAKRQQAGGRHDRNDRNDRNRGRNARRGGAGNNNNTNNAAANGNKKSSALTDPAEKAKAEARAKRFA
ncbi:SAP domain-containing ribonucleoprotein [Microdochium nivale]|nr:SAP domain-containing ribonucleoprotein [Microdochium nivale]